MDLTAYLNRYGVGVIKAKPHGSATLHCLEKCIFDESHVNNESAIGQTADGTLFCQCFHNSCKDRNWHGARQIISGDDSLTDFYPSTRLLGTAKGNMPQPQVNGSVSLLCAADIKPEPVSWLWDGYIAQGKVHILAGPAGHGKTTVLLALGSTITVAGRWPDGSRTEAGDVAIWSGEDDSADTLVPRLISCGADLQRVHFINGVIADGDHMGALNITANAGVQASIEHAGGLKLKGMSKLTVEQKNEIIDYARKHKHTIITALKKGADGDCDNCPAAGYWDLLGPGRFCFHRAYFLDKSGKSVRCDAVKTVFPLGEIRVVIICNDFMVVTPDCRTESL